MLILLKFFGLFFLSCVLYAKTTCLYRSMAFLNSPQFDSSVELELDLNTSEGAGKIVLDILTTENGLVGGLYNNKQKKIPSSFKTWAKKNNLGDPRDIAWDRVPDEFKISLLRDISKDASFFEDRSIPGMRVKKSIYLNFSQSTRFLGEDYPPGRHKIDASKLLGGAVEYRNPFEVKQVSGVELHFRAKQSAGTTSNDAWKLLAGLGIARNHQHIHIVSKMPYAKLQEDPEVMPLVLADFVRRTNLAAEMLSIVEEGGRIGDTLCQSLLSFGMLKPERLNKITKFFTDEARISNSGKLNRFLGLAWVTFVAPGKYDDPSLWGLEFRSIIESSDPDAYKAILDAIQYKMENDEYGIDPTDMRRWSSARYANEIPITAISNEHYNRPWRKLFSGADKKVKKAAGLWFRYKVRLDAWSSNAYEYKMLIHNWSHDPLWLNAPDSVTQKIIEQQVIALKRLRKGERRKIVMKDFLLNSGLYEKMMESVGVQVSMP